VRLPPKALLHTLLALAPFNCPAALTAPPTSRAPQAPAPTAVEEPTKPPVAPVALGLDGVPSPVSRRARDANTAALKAHRAGRFEESARGFEEAVGLSPGYALARFNLACARARLGQLDAAATELAPLLERDPSEFEPRFLEDEDLAALRDAPQGAALRERLHDVDAAARTAAARGLPAVMWRAGAHWAPDVLRAGVYLHAERRFVPLVPALPGAQSAFASPALGTGVAVKLAINDCKFDFCPRIEGVDVKVWKLDDARAMAPFHYQSSFMVLGAKVALGPAGARVELYDPAVGTDILAFSISGSGVSRARPGGSQGPARAVIDVDERGAALRASAEGFRVRGHVLVTPDGLRPIDLAAAHSGRDHAISVSPDGRAAVVASTRDRCECIKFEGPVFDYVVSTVDLATRKATRIAAGEGTAAAAFDPEGSLYVQLGDSLRRWTGVDGEPVMRGVLLVPPEEAPSNCCGL